MILNNYKEHLLDSDLTIVFMEKVEVLLVLMGFIFSILSVLVILSILV